ncbi:MAG: hypothetical protein EOO42_19730, partial [Flavobacteriales bacterium]
MRGLSLILVFLSQLCFGQSKAKGEIIISGSFDLQYLRSFKERPEIWFYDQYEIGLENNAKKIPLRIIDGKFSIQILPKNKVGYFLFKGEFDRGPAYLLSLFIIEQGDSLNISIQNEQQATVKGKGSEKLNFQKFFAELNSCLYESEMILLVQSASPDTILQVIAGVSALQCPIVVLPLHWPTAFRLFPYFSAVLGFRPSSFLPHPLLSTAPA